MTPLLLISLLLSPSVAYLFALPSLLDRLPTHLQSPRTAPLSLKNDNDDTNVVFGGNDWKPQGGPASTDTGDFFPEDYEGGPNFEHTPQGMSGGGTRDVALPGMDFSAGGLVIGGTFDFKVTSGKPSTMTILLNGVRGLLRRLLRVLASLALGDAQRRQDGTPLWRTHRVHR